MKYSEHTKTSFEAARRDYGYFLGYMAERASKYANWLDEIYDDSDHEMRFIINEEENKVRVINPDTWFEMPLDLMWEPSHNFMNALYELKMKKDKAMEDWKEQSRLEKEKRELELYEELSQKYGNHAANAMRINTPTFHYTPDSAHEI